MNDIELVDPYKNSSFGETLQALRKDERMTMKELSVESNVSQSYISQLENDVRLPSDKVIKKIAKALSVSENFVETYNSSNLFGDDLTDFDFENRQEQFTKILNKKKQDTINKNLETTYLAQISKDNTKKISLTPTELQLIQLFKQLATDKQESVLEYIKFLSK